MEEKKELKPFKMKIRFYHMLMGGKLYEADVIMNNGETVNHVMIPGSHLIDEGIIKRFPAIRKAETWFNSREGLDYIHEVMKRKEERERVF